MLNQIVVTSFPNLEVDKKRSIKTQLEKLSEIKSNVNKESKLSNEDLDKWLRGVLGG